MHVVIKAIQRKCVRAVVVGAGYAGTIAANRLAKQVKEAEITVVNPRADFVERVRLNEEIAGTGQAATPLAAMLGDGIATRMGTADRIGDGVVLLADGTSLEFDYLFVAVGSSVAAMPGTVAVGTWEGAAQARTALAAVAAGGAVTVVGGDLTGIEATSELAEARPDLNVRLVGGRVAASLSERARARTRKGLQRLDVESIEDVVAEARDGVVRLRSGADLASDLTLWAIIADIPDLVRCSGLRVTDEGRAVVDEYLRSVDNPRIFVVGDCAAVPGARLCCAASTPQGAHAADTLARIVRGHKPKPHSMGYVGEALSLGRHDGLIQAVRRDDGVRRMFIAGRPAAVAKEQISRYAKYGSRTTNYAWIGGPR